MSQVRVSVERTDYPVSGDSREAVLQSIEQNGPERKGERFAAYTDWEISWNFALRPSSKRGLFHVTDPSVQAKVLVTLPSRKIGSGAPSSFRAQWNKARTALERHEAEHVAFALAAGERVLAKLKKLGPLRSSNRATVDEIVKREIGVIQKEERQHDKTTQHGITQGTAL